MVMVRVAFCLGVGLGFRIGLGVWLRVRVRFRMGFHHVHPVHPQGHVYDKKEPKVFKVLVVTVNTEQSRSMH